MDDLDETRPRWSDLAGGVTAWAVIGIVITIVALVSIILVLALLYAVHSLWGAL